MKLIAEGLSPDRKIRCTFFLKVFLFSLADIAEFLGVPVKKREPGTLHMHHYSMAFTEGVEYIREAEFNLSRLPGDEGLRIFEAVPEFPPDDVPANQPLVSPDLSSREIIFRFVGIELKRFLFC